MHSDMISVNKHEDRNELSFVVRPCLDKRQRTLVSDDWTKGNLTIVANDTVLLPLDGYKPVNFKTNGEVIHQEDGIDEDLKDSKVFCESEMINKTKFIAYQKNELVAVLKYDASGKAKKVG